MSRKQSKQTQSQKPQSTTQSTKETTMSTKPQTKTPEVKTPEVKAPVVADAAKPAKKAKKSRQAKAVAFFARVGKTLSRLPVAFEAELKTALTGLVVLKEAVEKADPKVFEKKGGGGGGKKVVFALNAKVQLKEKSAPNFAGMVKPTTVLTVVALAGKYAQLAVDPTKPERMFIPVKDLTLAPAQDEQKAAA